MWFITVFAKVERGKNGWAEFGSQRTWGFYETKGAAARALHENWTDMWEGLYDYAVLEKFYTGIAHCDYDSRQWFKFDRERDGYFEIEEPECVKHLGSFALG